MVTGVEAASVTLTCSESASFPPANTTWRRGLKQELILNGSKYVVSVEGPDVRLTILNVSKADEGFYFCRSENALIVTELEVFLAVKGEQMVFDERWLWTAAQPAPSVSTASSVNTGAVIGVFIAALILGCTFVVAKSLYSNRHQVCLGNVVYLCNTSSRRAWSKHH